LIAIAAGNGDDRVSEKAKKEAIAAICIFIFLLYIASNQAMEIRMDNPMFR